MFRIIYFIAFLVVAQPVFSQVKTVSGVVLDSKNNTPIKDVNVFIENTSIGVITNENGNFKIVFPMDKNKLVISHIGYSKKKLIIDNIESNREIFLDSKNFVLDEVVITQGKTESNPNLIMGKAFSKLASDLSQTEPAISRSFIRHTERSKDKYELLIEAALEIYDPGALINSNNIKINILQTRKSFDNREIDTVKFYRVYLNATNGKSYNKNYEAAWDYKTVSKEKIKKAIAYYDNHYTAGYNKDKGLLEKVLGTDINKLRFFNQKKSSFSKNALKEYSFTLDSVLRVEDGHIYKVKFSKYERKEKELSAGWFYVRSRDFAIVELQFSQILGNSHHLKKINISGAKYTTKIKYKEYNNVMYPFYLSHKTFKFNTSLVRSFDENEDLSYYTHEEMLFPEIYTDKSIVKDKIENIELWDSNLFKARPYDEIFWNSQNIILESDKNQKMRIDLEEKVGLKEQFLQTNNKKE